MQKILQALMAASLLLCFSLFSWPSRVALGSFVATSEGKMAAE